MVRDVDTLSSVPQSPEERRRLDAERARTRYRLDAEHRENKKASMRAYARLVDWMYMVGVFIVDYYVVQHAKKHAVDPAYRARRRAASRAWRATRTEVVRGIMRSVKDKPCIDCGIQLHPRCVEFDHVRGQKLFSVSAAAAQAKTDKEIAAEIAKCDVRCVVCRRIRHQRKR